MGLIFDEHVKNRQAEEGRVRRVLFDNYGLKVQNVKQFIVIGKKAP